MLQQGAGQCCSRGGGTMLQQGGRDHAAAGGAGPCCSRGQDNLVQLFRDF